MRVPLLPWLLLSVACLPGDIANRISSGRRIQQQDLPVRPYGQH